VLEQGTFWRKTSARNARLLIDAAEYFPVLREALLAARHAIWIVGWDIHSRMRFFGPADNPADGWPSELGDFLKALAHARPELSINILVWKSAFLYVGEREWFPAAHFRGPSNLLFCLDESLPLGSAQHQKFVVVDDAFAFVGGLDLTIRRWDDGRHIACAAHRVDADGRPYPPFHDIQLMVHGKAAQDLAELARVRFVRAGRNNVIGPVEPKLTWPRHLEPHFTDATFFITRTEPGSSGYPQIEEVRKSILASIKIAERSIYVENQFLSSVEVAHHLRNQLLESPRLEVLLVAPRQHHSWIESRTMRNGRLEFMDVFDDRLRQRIRLVSPQVCDGGAVEPVMVHSKLMIIDDKFLRVGSANLNNRSLGADTECDLVLVAERPDERRALADIRNSLVAHHCGVAPHAVEEACATGSLLAAVSLSANGHSLEPIDDGVPDPRLVYETIMPIADPPKPLAQKAAHSRRKWNPLLLPACSLAIVALVALAWKFTPLQSLVTPETLTNLFERWSGWSAALAVILAFVLGGLVVFPVLVLIAATAASLDPATGLVSSVCGIMASAAITFAIGRLLGENAVSRIASGRLEQIRKQLVGNGILAVAAIRLILIAPFSLVNFAAGALGIDFVAFLVGTVLGMAPGLIAIFALGATISAALKHPTLSSVILLVSAAALWLLASMSAQYVLKRIGRRR
jgi:phospholipase D1/2